MKHIPCANFLAHQPGGRLLPMCLILALLVTWLLADTASAGMSHEPSPTSPTLPQALGWAGGFNAPGMDNVVEALAVGPDGSLYAGGNFRWAGGISANHIARWDGSTPSWHALGNGVNGDVRALAFVPDGSLYVGGEFTAADYRPSTHMARWGEVTPTAVTLAWFDPLANHGSVSTVGLALAMFCLALTAGTTLARGRART